MRPPGWGMPRAARLWLPVVLSLLIQVPAVFIVGSAGPDFNPVLARPALWELAIAVIGPLALIGARRFPGPVVAVVTAAAALDLLTHSPANSTPYVALAFAIVGAMARGARIWAWASIGAAWVISLLVGILTGVELHPGRIAATTFGILLLLGIGEAIRTRREHYEQFRSMAVQRRQTEVQAERVRIARELHDVLAHSLSQINVQAAVGLHLMDKQPAKAAEALASIKESSKTALDEVRTVLGVLRAEDGQDPSAPLVPEPDFARLPGLAATVTAQGIEVTLRNSVATAPKAIQLAIYRIVQESLTNVIRHADATRARVEISLEEGGYVVSVTDDGRGEAVAPDSGGRGLLGMRERAELLGGTLTAGPAPGRGFRVTARIPHKEPIE